MNRIIFFLFFLTRCLVGEASSGINGVLDKIGNAHGYIAFYTIGPTAFLGNFTNCPNGINFEGHHFKNSEAAFQWMKFQLAAQYYQRQDILNDPEMELFFVANGKEAFHLSRKFDRKYRTLFAKKRKLQRLFLESWCSGLRDQVMWNILIAKFQQNANFATSLLATRPHYLLEHNPKEGRDKYWSDDSTGDGLNMLGKQLMAIRDNTLCPPPHDDSDRLQRTQYSQDFRNKTPYKIF